MKISVSVSTSTSLHDEQAGHDFVFPADYVMNVIKNIGEEGCEKCEVKVFAAQSWLTLGDPMDCSLPGSSVHGILQARIPEWVAIPFSRGSSRLRDWTQVSWVEGSLYHLSHQKGCAFQQISAPNSFCLHGRAFSHCLSKRSWC